jgi:hypothetical protein
MKKFKLKLNIITKSGFHREIPGLVRHVSDAGRLSILKI